MACKQGIFAIESDGPNGPLNRVAVDLAPAVSEEDLQTIPVATDVGELFAKAGFGRDAAALIPEPEAEV